MNAVMLAIGLAGAGITGYCAGLWHARARAARSRSRHGTVYGGGVPNVTLDMVERFRHDDDEAELEIWVSPGRLAYLRALDDKEP